jgi:hypothetical protein
VKIRLRCVAESMGCGMCVKRGYVLDVMAWVRRRQQALYNKGVQTYRSAPEYSKVTSPNFRAGAGSYYRRLGRSRLHANC